MPFLLIGTLEASLSNLKKNKIKYRTFFGRCPSRVAGSLTLGLVKEFERRSLLSDVKKKIINEKSREFILEKYLFRSDGFASERLYNELYLSLSE